MSTVTGQDQDRFSVFLDTTGYYDSFYAFRPIPGFPFDKSRDQARPGTGPGQPGYPTCREWWSEDDAGLMDRITKQVDTSLWSEFQSIFPGNASAEEYMVRRMVSPRSGAANGNDQLILGFVSTMMFLVLPEVWMGALGWTGYNVGSSIGSRSTLAHRIFDRVENLERKRGSLQQRKENCNKACSL